MKHEDVTLTRWHALILLGPWFIGTALLMIAASAAPTVFTGPITVDFLDGLGKHWDLYAGGYGCFFIADCAIALLGVPLVVWLRPEGYRRPAIVALFILSGMLGVLADVQMLAASQLFRNGSAWLTTGGAAGFLDWLNASCNWLSAASFLPAGIAVWLLCPAARKAGARRWWIALTRFGAIFQLFTGLFSAAAFLSAQALANSIALVLAVAGMPIFALIWIAGMLHEMKRDAAV